MTTYGAKFKSRICRFYQGRGARCHAGAYCQYAHGELELRDRNRSLFLCNVPNNVPDTDISTVLGEHVDERASYLLPYRNLHGNVVASVTCRTLVDVDKILLLRSIRLENHECELVPEILISSVPQVLPDVYWPYNMVNERLWKASCAADNNPHHDDGIDHNIPTTFCGQNFKSTICRFYTSNEGCRRGIYCTFAHGETELRSQERSFYLSGLPDRMSGSDLSMVIGHDDCIESPECYILQYRSRDGKIVASVTCKTYEDAQQLFKSFPSQTEDTKFTAFQKFQGYHATAAISPRCNRTPRIQESENPSRVHASYEAALLSLPDNENDAENKPSSHLLLPDDPFNMGKL